MNSSSPFPGGTPGRTSRLEEARTALHPLLSVLTSWSFAAAAALLLNDVLGAIIPLFLALALSLAVAVSALAFAAAREREKAGAAARIRECILTLCAVYAIASIFEPVPWERKIFPAWGNCIALASCAYTWLCTVSIREAFRYREWLMEAVEGKRGGELQSALRDEFSLSADAIEKLRRVVLRLRVQLVALAAVFAVFQALGSRTGWFSYLALALCAVLVPVTETLFSTYRDEQLAAGEGLSVDPWERARRMKAGILLSAAVLILAFVLSTGKSIFPFEWILAFIAWLIRLFLGDQDLSGTIAQALRRKGSALGGRDLAERLKDVVPVVDLSFLWEILRIAAIAASAVVVIAFILAPLARGGALRFLASLRPARSIAAWFAAIGTLFRRMLRFLTGSRTPTGVAAISAEKMKLRGMLQRLPGEGRSEAKKKEFGELVGAFMDVVEWGTKRGKPWSPSRGPAEHCAVLAADCPVFSPELRAVADIFEECVYGDALVPEARRLQLKASSAAICAPSAEGNSPPGIMK